MSLKLMVNTEGNEVPRDKVLGPEAGAVFPYFAKGGIPCVIEEPAQLEGIDYAFADPRPGMVVVHVRTLALYQCDVDGQLVPLGMRLPRGYNDGRRLGHWLETDDPQRQSVIDVINIYGDEVLHKALDDIGFLPRCGS